MRAVLLILAAVVALAVTGYWFAQRAMSRDTGRLIGYAVGNTGKTSGELNVCITREMTVIDPPRQSNFVPLWIEWVHDHFELRDSAGQRLEMNRAGTSTVIKDREAFNPEFFINARVTVGTQYTLDYIPVVGESKRYRHTFTVGPEGITFERIYFPPVEEKAGA